jgi:transposase
MGRNNHIFNNSHESAQHASIIYFFLGNCKLNNINPQEKLLGESQKLATRNANYIDDLIPQNWNPELQGIVQLLLTL